MVGLEVVLAQALPSSFVPYHTAVTALTDLSYNPVS